MSAPTPPDRPGTIDPGPHPQDPDPCVRFSDLVGVSRRPDRPEPARRRHLDVDGATPRLSDDLANSGFVAALGDLAVDDVVLVKASRAAGLESVVAALTALTA